MGVIDLVWQRIVFHLVKAQRLAWHLLKYTVHLLLLNRTFLAASIHCVLCPDEKGHLPSHAVWTKLSPCWHSIGPKSSTLARHFVQRFSSAGCLCSRLRGENRMAGPWMSQACGSHITGERHTGRSAEFVEQTNYIPSNRWLWKKQQRAAIRWQFPDGV